MEKAVRVLLVDDDVQLGAMLTEYLNKEGFDTSTVHDGESAVSELASGNYGVIILDIMLPGLSGTEVLQKIRQSSRIPVIMLTARGDDVDRVVGLEMGADDYLAKPFYMRELVARMRAVLRRAGNESAEEKGPLLFEGLALSSDERRCTFGGAAIDVTASEFNLLHALMRAGSRVSSKDELSRTALGHAHSPYDRSVDVHISRLRAKLAAASGGQVEIETIRGIGYRLRHGT